MKRVQSWIRKIRYVIAVVVGFIASLLLFGILATWGDPNPSDPKGDTTFVSVILLLFDLSVAYVAWKIWPRAQRAQGITDHPAEGAPADGIAIPPTETTPRHTHFSNEEELPLEAEPTAAPPVRERTTTQALQKKGGIDFSKLVESRSVGGRYAMDYMDSKGNFTERKIDLKKVYVKGNTIYFAAYCHLRNGIKTFRADSVLSLEDLDNGMTFDQDIELVFAGMLLRG